LPGTTSRRASRCRTPLPNPSSGACATNCSTRPCSARSRTPEPCWKLGVPIQPRAAPLAARLDESNRLRRSTAVRCAALYRRLRSADRCNHRPTGHRRPSDSNCRWIKLGGNVTPNGLSRPICCVRWWDRGLQKRLPSVLGYSAEPAELGYSGTARARS
jgi:hypothetical protein